MPYIKTNGINMNYEIHGSGSAVVLIPGLGYDMWMWHKMVPGLAEKFRVISIDNRGTGNTDKPEGPYSAEMLADDTVGLLDRLEIDSATIFGHSMGGFIAQALVLKYPHRVDKLILSATNFGGPRHIPVTQEAMAVLSDTQTDPIVRLRKGILISCAPGFQQSNPDFVEEWISYRINNPIEPQAYQAQMAIGLGLISAEAAFDGKLGNIQAPTLILFGEHDKVVPPENATLIHEQIPNSTIEILPGAGHFFPFEIPDQAVEAVASFIEDH